MRHFRAIGGAARYIWARFDKAGQSSEFRSVRFSGMTRFNEATVIWMVTSLLAFQSCMSAENPKIPPQGPNSGSTGGSAPAQGGSAPSAGGMGDTGGAEPATGGSESLGGGMATGGDPASGGFPPSTGGSNSTGGEPPTTGGKANSGGCDFGSAACANPCDSFASSPSSSWKQAPCQALLTCLDENASCITASDVLCGPKQAPSYAAPACGNDYYNAASDSEMSTALTTYVKCVCGF
jgi:hypothetical protein